MRTAPAAPPEKRLRNGHLSDSNTLNRHTFKAFAHSYLEQLAEMGNWWAHAALAAKFQAVFYYSTRQATKRVSLSPLPVATSTSFTTKEFMCHPDLEPGLTCLALHTGLFTLILVCDMHIPETCHIELHGQPVPRALNWGLDVCSSLLHLYKLVWIHWHWNSLVNQESFPGNSKHLDLRQARISSRTNKWLGLLCVCAMRNNHFWS